MNMGARLKQWARNVLWWVLHMGAVFVTLGILVLVLWWNTRGNR
jgi:hypothetical protein